MNSEAKWKTWLCLLSCLVGWCTTVAQAQSLREVFKRVNPSVVVVHTHEESRVKAALAGVCPPIAH